METTRAEIAIYKINYKSDFILTVVCDVEWNTPFCIKFWTGEPSQAYYVGWTGHEYKNCKVVESDPSKLLVLFDDHHLPVGELKMQIVYHTTIEDFPNAIVDEVTNSMKVMAYIDGKNQKIALDFEGEEDAELQFELPAYANEAQRIANEEQRIANEQARIEAEQQRIDNEQTRQDNEAQRIAQETARVNEYAELKANAVAATNAANDAATLADQKAQLAADKAVLADAAATLAAQKAQLAADKAALADAAATLANQKAALAQQKAEYAQTQGDYAKAQGDYAKEQGEIAEEDHERAEADHTRAESDHATAGNDHATAGNDHTQAGTDHSTAVNDHTQADTDHTRAESDHTQATSDHTQAGADHTRAESDHTTASADHTQAGQDHTRAESDHTRAESDHAAVEVYVDSMGAFDISAYHATGGVLAKYADLTAALGTNGANIPEAIRKGGMSVKFVQTYDNKYVQYRLMADAWSVDTNDWAIAEEGVYVENPEFIYVKLDVEDKILYGIKSDGEFFFGKGCPKQVKDYIEEKISSLSLDEYEDIVAFLSDYLGSDTTLKVMIDGINASLEDKLDAEGLDPDALGTVQAVENPEYVQVTTDSEDKILEATEKDGTKVFGGDVKLLGNMEVSGVSYKVIENPEYIEVKTDSEGKIISYRDSKGVLHENVGIEAEVIKTNSLILSGNAITQVDKIIDNHIEPKKWNLPKFGKVNIKSEIFYLTADSRWSTINDVVCIQMYDDTDENAGERKTLSYYYIKSTLTPLPDNTYDRTSVNANSVQLQLFGGKDVANSNGQFFVKKITKVDGEYYLTSSLVENNGVYSIDNIYGIPCSMKVNYNDGNPDQTTLTNAIEVRQAEDVPPVKAWAVTKTIEHYCVADIDFGDFYSKKNVAVGIKYQGSGTTGLRKRGFRLTFYKNRTYAKKDKVKIGEMVRLSGFNMKSYGNDETRVKDPVLTNIFMEMWQERGKDAYPWNANNCLYNGATGMIKSFPTELDLGGNFYGLYFFGLKKDEKNYMLDGTDESGILVSGSNSGAAECFDSATHDDCEDEMMDEMTQSTADALDEFFKYCKGFTDGTIEIDGQTVDFTNDMLEERIDINDWVDYWIGLEIFTLWDNAFHNCMIYSGKDKEKFSLYFYDLDNSMQYPANSSYVQIMNETGWNIAFWKKFIDVYKDYILNRYAGLRDTVLNNENITAIYNRYIQGIPQEVVSQEVAMWGNGNISDFKRYIKTLNSRLEYLDKNNFNL